PQTVQVPPSPSPAGCWSATATSSHRRCGSCAPRQDRAPYHRGRCGQQAGDQERWDSHRDCPRERAAGAAAADGRWRHRLGVARPGELRLRRRSTPMTERTIDTHPGTQQAAITRRSVLVGAGAGALGVAATGTRVHALGGDAARSGAFAMVTDTHANLQEPDRTAALERIFAHIEERDAQFVLNCGDITDLGAADEFELYNATIPPALRGKVR